MSLNFGNRFAELAFQMKDDPRFVEMRVELGKHANKAMSRAIEAPVEHRVEQTAYARAVRDLFVIFEASSRRVHATHVTLPDTPFIEEMHHPAPTHPTPPPEPVEVEHPLARGRRGRQALPATTQHLADDILA